MLSQLLCLALFCSLSAENRQGGDSAIDLEEFVSGYHARPEPDRVPAMLDLVLKAKDRRSVLPGIGTDPRDLLLGFLMKSSEVRVPTAHAFGHMARGNPKLVREYESRFAAADANGRAFLLEALNICGDASTERQLKAWSEDARFADAREAIAKVRCSLTDPRRRLPRDLAPRSPTDLDLLWADFFVTGEYAPVARILDVLDPPGSLRKRIVDRLSKASGDRDELLKLLESLKLVQSGTKDKLVAGDLEMVLLRDAKGRLRAGALEIASYLGEKLNLSEKDLERGLLLQGTAIWSVQSNLEQHPRLVQVLKQHYKERPARSQELVKIWLRIDQPPVVLDKESRRLQGTWQAISCQEDGDEDPPQVQAEILKYLRWTFEDDEVKTTKAFTIANIDGNKRTREVRGPGETAISSYRTSKVGNRNVIALETISPEEGYVLRAIYEIDGDVLRVCWKTAEDKLPDGFASGRGSGCVLATFKRRNDH
jgi:uncharacterized protein (TIGR03067 family)